MVDLIIQMHVSGKQKARPEAPGQHLFLQHSRNPSIPLLKSAYIRSWCDKCGLPLVGDLRKIAQLGGQADHRASQ